MLGITIKSIAAIFIVTLGLGSAQDNATFGSGYVVAYPPGTHIKPGAYIVELDDITPGEHLGAVSSAFFKFPGVDVGSRYSSVFNGMAVTTKNKVNAAELARINGVKRVWPVRYHKLQYSKSAVNGSYPTLLQQTGVAQTMQELGFNGTGVKIGIVDSGVDYNHPELGSCWKTSGCPWQFGKDFIGDKYDASSPAPILDPNPTPMDCDGHGTHVSGIIAARGPLVHGVAVGATLGMYRVFSCPVDGNVYSSDDIILQGIEAAYQDGHNIISLSLGGGTWPEDPLSVACARVVEKGIVVVAAIGNDGDNGLYTAGSPAVGEGVIGVGSVDNWNITGSIATISMPYRTLSVLLSMAGSEAHPFVFETPMPIAASVDENGNDEGCNKPVTELSGKVALVRRGTCTFTQKALIAQAAGAIGVLVYNNAAGMLSPGINNTVSIPVVLISENDGLRIANGISQGKEATITAHKSAYGTFPADTGGMMSSFSSYGPTAELGVAPLVSAPGGNIWSTYPIKLGSYTTLSGTSMATPFVSGVAALLKQAHPNLRAGDIRNVLVATAQPLLDSDTGRMVHPYHSGAGLINAYNAIRSHVIFNPSVVAINGSNWNVLSNINDPHSGSAVQWIVREVKVTNTDSHRGMHVWLENSIANSLTMYMPNGSLALTPQTWPPSLHGADKLNSINSSEREEGQQNSHPQVLTPNIAEYVVAGKTSHITIYIAAPSGLRQDEHWYYGGFLNFTVTWDNDEDKGSFYIPYAGFNGNYRQIDVLAPASTGLPVIADSQMNPIDNLQMYTVTANNSALIVYSLAVPSRIVAAMLIDQNSTPLGYLPYGYIEYATRNLPSSTTPFSAAVINGTVYVDKGATQLVSIPAGKYRVQLSALRPFGNEMSSADFQTWYSPLFNIG
ncbi:peptidase S8/S53 domain-containing protein [Coemansia spiralis]|nr:peptidase S8/S53 domain-containing protein [Coemansia spiralis]